MNRSSIALAFVLGCVSGGVASRIAEPAARAGAPGAVQRWEYDCGNNPPMAELNAAGAQGWELVSTTQLRRNNDVMVCFKRPLL